MSTSPRIERGAALLDKHAPGWTDRIDLDTLDLSHSAYCIVGQLYGDYTEGLEKLDGDAERHPASFGFVTWGSEPYWSLTWKWRDFIRARRERS